MSLGEPSPRVESGSAALNLTKSAGSIPALIKKEKDKDKDRDKEKDKDKEKSSMVEALSFLGVLISTAGEDLIPAYSKFKGAFESLLEGQDFSKKKKEHLQRMSKEQKWSLLTQYRDSTLHLLVTLPQLTINLGTTLTI